MANGTIHKLGTLYYGGTKQKRPTKPWYSTNGSASETGDLLYISGDTTNSIEIKNSDTSDDYKLQWVEVNDGSEKILICDRNIMSGVTWNRLNTLGFASKKGSGKNITIDGQQYELFMLTGGTSSSAETESTPSNEWDKYIGNLGKFSGLPTPEAQDLKNSTSAENFKTTHNKKWNWAGCYSWCFDTYNSSYRAERGYSGARDWGYNDPDYGGDNLGWRPALKILNTAPKIMPVSKNYGSVKTAPSISITVTDSDGDDINGVVKLDGTQKTTFSGKSGSAEYTIPVSEWWADLSLAQHTITVEATDTKSAKATVTYTFTKTNSSSAVPTMTTPKAGQRKEEEFYVEFVIGEDSEGDSQTVKVQASENQEFSSPQEFTEAEKYTGDTWESVSVLTNEDIGTQLRIKVTGLTKNKEYYIRVAATDSGSETPSYSTAVKIRIGTVLEIETQPMELSARPTGVSVVLKSTVDPEAYMQMWVTNNANDEAPEWESYILGTMHRFVNEENTSDKWAVAAKVKIEAQEAAGEISISAIGMGVI